MFSTSKDKIDNAYVSINAGIKNEDDEYLNKYPGI